MSYILDALKKSEREKTLGQVPTLETVVSGGARQQSSSWPWWLVLLLGIVVLAAILGVVYKSGIIDLSSFRQQAPDGQQAVVETVEPAAVEPAPVIQQTEPEQPPVQLPSRIVAAEQLQNNSASISTIKQPEVAVPASETEQAESADTDSSGTAAADEQSAAVETVQEPVPSSEAGQAPAPVVEPQQDSATEPAVADYETVLHDKLRNISVNVVTWSAQPRQRFTMLDLTIYKEGDTLPVGADVAEIIQTGVVVEFEGKRYLLKP